jgi:CubicO group peptidase (beta-lactamase class C family)
MTTLTRDSAQVPFRGEDGRQFGPCEPATPDLEADVRAILNRRPAIGLALAVAHAGRPTFLQSHGVADVASNTPVTDDTVFRIGSITKLFTAIAVMQLWEHRLVDLDAPANGYLRAYNLIPGELGWRPATLRHLLTHTAGIPDARGLGDLLHASFTPAGGRPPHLSVAAGEPLPSLAEYYRSGLRVVAEPGTAFAYTNHGFATLGQIVEDVSGRPLADYFRQRIFDPLGMADTDLVRSERLAQRLAMGYVMGRTGPRAVAQRDWIGAGSGGIYSTAPDMALFIDALLAGGANEHGRILEPATLGKMFEPQFQPDPRIPGLGLGFFRSEAGGHRAVGHGGILPGFNSELLIAPDDGVGLIAMTNGSSGAFSWLQIELDHLLCELLGVPDVQVRHDLPHHPETWADLCGRYVLAAGATDLRQRVMFGGGAEVFVRGGRLMARLLTPIPALYRGIPLEPDADHDSDAFLLDVSRFGMAPVRVVFSRSGGGQVNAAHTDLGGQPWSLVRRPEGKTQRRWLRPALAAVIAAGFLATRSRRQRVTGGST